jgi:putative transposase
MNYKKDTHFSNRQSIRLKGYDYSQEGLYFITICCQNRLHLFGEIIEGKMQLNDFGKIVAEEWLKTPEIRKNISLGNFIIMPNHMHGIISINTKASTEMKKNASKFHSPTQTIGAIIRGYKGATTKRINNLIRLIKEDSHRTGELQFAPRLNPSIINLNSLSGEGSIWQRNYWEHIIRDDPSFDRISEYIANNPKKWKADQFISD